VVSKLGNLASKRDQSVYTTSPAIQIHEESTNTGIPRTVVIRNERPNMLGAYPPLL
jgi:hypothetical protein